MHGKKENLRWYEAIRKRPGMYVGKTNAHGFATIMRGILDYFQHSIQASSISWTFLESLRGVIECNGIAHKKIDTSDFFSDSNIITSALDVNVLNAMSSKFSISFDGKKSTQTLHYEKGILSKNHVTIDKIQVESITIHFELDPTIWTYLEKWNYSFLSHTLREYSFLNPSTKNKLLYHIDHEEFKELHHHPKGLLNKLEIALLNRINTPILIEKEQIQHDNWTLDIAWAIRSYAVNSSYIDSFVNNEKTVNHGTHVQGFMKGIKEGVNIHYSINNKLKLAPNWETILEKMLLCFLHLTIKDACYNGSVKDELNNPEIIAPIKSFLSKKILDRLQTDALLSQQLRSNLEYCDF